VPDPCAEIELDGLGGVERLWTASTVSLEFPDVGSTLSFRQRRKRRVPCPKTRVFFRAPMMSFIQWRSEDGVRSWASTLTA
jgi:hypothetical protein